MGRRFFAFFCVVVLVVSFTLPVFAVNTVGQVQQDLVFQGVSFDQTSNKPTYYGVNSVVSKSLLAVDSFSFNVVRFWFLAPAVSGDFKVKAQVGVATDYGSVSQMNWYGYKAINFATGTFTVINPHHSGNIVGNEHSNGLFNFTTSWETNLNESYDSIVLEIVFRAAIPLNTSFTYSSSGTVSQSGSVTRGAINSDVNISTVHTGSSTSGTNAPFILLESVYENANHAWIYVNQSNITIAKAQIRLPQETMALSSSGSVSQNLTASAASDVMAYGSMTLTYGDDDGLVDTVKHMDKTLDTVSGNMQKIVDNMDKQDDTAADIGTAAGDQTISNTGETLSGGVQSLDQSLDTAGNVSSFASGASMYTGLLTATVGPLLNFGNGVLYWALFAVVILSVLLFILRRLDG